MAYELLSQSRKHKARLGPSKIGGVAKFLKKIKQGDAYSGV